jgi:hypothetical protein
VSRRYSKLPAMRASSMRIPASLHFAAISPARSSSRRQMQQPGCISRAANDQIRDKLSLAFADLGEQTVKKTILLRICRDHGELCHRPNTAFTDKGKSVDVKQFGRDLGVRYVLEGSVRRAPPCLALREPNA